MVTGRVGAYGMVLASLIRACEQGMVGVLSKNE